MTKSDASRAAGLLQGVVERVGKLERAVTSADGIPNLLRFVTEDVSVTETVSAVAATVAASDQTDAADTVSVTEGSPESFTWGTNKWGFGEWG